MFSVITLEKIMKNYSFAGVLLAGLFCFSSLSYADVANEQGTEIVKNAIQDIWVNHNFDKVDQYYASDFQGYEEAVLFNREQLKEYAKEDEKEYVTRKININDTIIEGNKVVVRMTMQAVDKKTQKPVTSYAIAIYQIHDQKIARVWMAAEPSLI
jgi:hypothetical protein